MLCLHKWRNHSLKFWRLGSFLELTLFFEEMWKIYPNRGRRGSTPCSRYWPFIHDFLPHIGDTIFAWRSPGGITAPWKSNGYARLGFWKKYPVQVAAGGKKRPRDQVSWIFPTLGKSKKFSKTSKMEIYKCRLADSLRILALHKCSLRIFPIGVDCIIPPLL